MCLESDLLLNSFLLDVSSSFEAYSWGACVTPLVSESLVLYHIPIVLWIMPIILMEGIPLVRILVLGCTLERIGSIYVYTLFDLHYDITPEHIKGRFYLKDPFFLFYLVLLKLSLFIPLRYLLGSFNPAHECLQM